MRLFARDFDNIAEEQEAIIQQEKLRMDALIAAGFDVINFDF